MTKAKSEVCSNAKKLHGIEKLFFVEWMEIVWNIMNWWHILFLSSGNFKWGREKLPVQFWQTSNSTSLLALIITIPTIRDARYVHFKYQIGLSLPSSRQNCLSNISYKFLKRFLPIREEFLDETALLGAILSHISFVKLVPGRKFSRIFGTNM